MTFQVGQNSLDIVKAIVANQSEIKAIKLILHVVGKNWRELNATPSAKIKNYLTGLGHLQPLRWKEYSREEFSFLTLEDLPQPELYQVWSMTSKVLCEDGKKRHIPMMNFHPEGIGVEEIRQSLKIICGSQKGVILNSGRYQHYYGDFLLEEGQWIKWMAEFLGPCILVSPRYIGHRLHHGYSTLRITRDEKYKPKIPEVIEVL